MYPTFIRQRECSAGAVPRSSPPLFGPDAVAPCAAAPPPLPPLDVLANAVPPPQQHPHDEARHTERAEYAEGDQLAAYFMRQSNANGISPDAEDIGDDSSPAAGALVDGETSAAKKFFIKEGNYLKVLFATVVGLTNDDNYPFINWDH